MKCKICTKQFDRGTATIPDTYCDKCWNNYVKSIPIKVNLIDYEELIKICEKEIKEYQDKIKQNEEQIKWVKDQIQLK